MPQCPYCNQEIDTLYSSSSGQLFWKDEDWTMDISDYYIVIACPVCYEELGPKDLSTLNVPVNLR